MSIYEGRRYRGHVDGRVRRTVHSFSHVGTILQHQEAIGQGFGTVGLSF